MGKVYDWKPKGMLSFAKSNKMACENCNAIFIDGGLKEGEVAFKLDLSKSQKEHEYAGQTLKKSEWERGTSDLDVVIQSNELPNYMVEGLPIILQEGEKSHYYTPATMYEERAVRQHVGGSVRIMKGVWVRAGQAESHGELRQIDSGAVLLTNQRAIFDGSSKKIEYKLPKIISITEFNDSFQIGVSNRKKSQIYTVDEPHKCTTYIQMAIDLYHKSKGDKKQSIKKIPMTKPKEELEVMKILNIRYAKGEITREEYEQMKRDVNG